ncbi:MAG: hypothetical protein HY927_08020 [Elusimicrobia bacterium]|nr:hypothetical protein [Elusimicrobiota bacterium]
MDEMTQAETSMPATRGDLYTSTNIFRGELKATEAVLRGEIKSTADALRGEVKSTADALRGEVKSTADALRGEVKSTADDLRAELKADIRGLDKKLDASVHRLATEIVRTQADVRGLGDRITGLATKDDVRDILAAIESFACKGERYDRTAVLHGHSLTELQVQVRDHESRIKNLESDRS